MEWYIKKGIPLNLDHLLIRSQDSGDWKEDTMPIKQFRTLLTNKINKVSFKSIREEIVKFIRDDEAIKIWSPEYFKDLIQKIKFK